MFGWQNPMRRLQNSLRQQFQTDPAVTVQRLPENQLLVTKDLVSNHEAQQQGKAASHVPAPSGFRVYLAVRTMEAHTASASQSQRIGPTREPLSWDAHTTALRVGPEQLDMTWTFLNRQHQVISIHARCGSAQSVDEVNRVLHEIQQVYLQ